MIKAKKVAIYENGYQVDFYKINPCNGKNKINFEDDYFED